MQSKEAKSRGGKAGGKATHQKGAGIFKGPPEGYTSWSQFRSAKADKAALDLAQKLALAAAAARR